LQQALCVGDCASSDQRRDLRSRPSFRHAPLAATRHLRQRGASGLGLCVAGSLVLNWHATAFELCALSREHLANSSQLVALSSQWVALSLRLIRTELTADRTELAARRTELVVGRTELTVGHTELAADSH
jgi:hypothetical protein